MRIGLATCERPVTRDADFDFIAAALRRRDVETTPVVWDDPSVDWGAFDLVLVSSTWDYHTQPDRFRDWLRLVNDRTLLRNDLATIEWSIDKRYLRQLEQAGVPTIPTIWTEPSSEDEIERTVAELGWSDVVVKPVVDLGAERLARVETAMVGRILRSLDEPAMAQPFLSSVESLGELSIVFIAGEPSHAVRKRPARGDFRVQQQYGGSADRVEAPAAALEIGRAALACVPAPPLYARADLVSDDDGALRLIELELIEPRLYLEMAAPSAEALARELLAAVRG